MIIAIIIITIYSTVQLKKACLTEKKFAVIRITTCR